MLATAVYRSIPTPNRLLALASEHSMAAGNYNPEFLVGTEALPGVSINAQLQSVGYNPRTARTCSDTE